MFYSSYPVTLSGIRLVIRYLAEPVTCDQAFARVGIPDEHTESTADKAEEISAVTPICLVQRGFWAAFQLHVSQFVAQPVDIAAQRATDAVFLQHTAGDGTGNAAGRLERLKVVFAAETLDDHFREILSRWRFAASNDTTNDTWNDQTWIPLGSMDLRETRVRSIMRFIVRRRRFLESFPTTSPQIRRRTKRTGPRDRSQRRTARYYARVSVTR